MFTLCDYQSEDTHAVCAAHADYSAVLVRWATGLGKGVLIAELARRYAPAGRVLVLVDVAKLVWQLAGTIERHTGVSPGLEMGGLAAAGDSSNLSDLFGIPTDNRIIVGTVQTQYAKDRDGRERFRRFDPGQFSLLLLDECETFLADGARKVVEHYRQNPALKIVGLSATPFRTDGKGMGRLFDFAADGAGPLNRDLLWGRDNGWLVPAMQGFVRVSVDFSTLEVKRRDDGERDYSDKEIAERLLGEQPMVELAKGIVDQAGERRSLVVCPNVECAVAVADYLDGERKGCARSIYGELSDQEKADLFGGHQAGEFQFLTSVMMLTKGYDDPVASVVFNCRKTRSRRLYQQIAGRVVRPLAGIVHGLSTADERKAAIAASGKPDALVVNMVGVEDSVRDITLVDLLGESRSEAVRERAKRKQEQGEDDPEEALFAAEEEIEAEKKEAEEKRRGERQRAKVKATVEAEYTADWSVGGGHVIGGADPHDPRFSHLPHELAKRLANAKVPAEDLADMSTATAKRVWEEIKRGWSEGLRTYKQARLLYKNGWSKSELHDMTFEAAGEAITALKANGWQRPLETV